MIIAYGGGITLSLYAIVKPLDCLKDALKNQLQYNVELYDDFIKVSFSKQFIDDFIGKVWEPRTHSSEIQSFKKIMESLFFEIKLYEDGYLETLIKTESNDVEKIIKEILDKDALKNGFADEIDSHFRDLYEVVYSQVHKHTYLRLYERLCHTTLIGRDNLDLITEKENVINYIRDILSIRLIRPLMENIDEYEDRIYKINFTNFLVKDLFGSIIYQYMSKMSRYLRRSIWALNYIGMCLPNKDTLKHNNKFYGDLDDFANLLNSRKEIADSIKNSIGYYISLISTNLTFWSVVLAIILIKGNSFYVYGPVIVIIFISTIFIAYVMYGSIKTDCERVKTGLLQ